MAPQQIGQFAILSELAQSGGSVVYKASDPKGRTVALRTVRLDAPGAAEIVPGFREAAKAASGLSSPNVAGIFGGGEAGGVFFVAVEFVEGVKLSSTLAKGEGVPMSEVLDLCRQVCTGLDHAHAKGIVHPELKPSNIIVEWDGTAKIMDFGVPRRHPAGEMNEATYYLSPEEVRGEALSPRSNLFSWAAMLYQLVSGHKPFNASDAQTLRRKIVEEMPVEPHELDPAVHPRVSEILLKALAKDPGARYGSGAELLSDLENYKRVEVAPPRPAAPRKSAAAPPPPAAGTQVWSPGEAGFPAAAPKKAPTPPPAPVVAPKPAPAPPKPAAAPPRPAAPTPTPAPAPAPAAAKAAPPAAPAKPAAKAAPRNPLLYALAGAGAVLLIVIVAGVFWMLRSPARNAAQPAIPAPAPAAPAAVAPVPEPAPASSKPAVPRAAKGKQPVAAPAPAPVATGGLSLDSSPQGAEVQIDGRHEAGWVTPFTATGLAVGPHTVSFAKPGHTALTRTAQVAAGQSAVVAVQLAELAATISVNSDPAGANVLLDGRDTGKVTPAQIIVAKGNHTVVVRKPGYLEASSALETAPGQTAQFSPTLKLTGSTDNIKTVGKFGGIFGGAQENQGRVSVRTNPKGAQVRVNGQPVKKTTPVDFYLNPGSYELTVTMEGYQPVKKIIDVEKGGKLTVDETLSH